MRQNKTSTILVLSFLVGFGGPLRAQDRSDFTQLQTTLKQDDTVTVTTAGGDKVKGRMLEISAERIVLRIKNGQRSFDAPQITRVQKRKNGVLLGAVIGAGAMVPVAIVLSEYIHNEGGSSASAAVPIAAGLGIGIGIDAAIGSNKTLYDRNSKKRVTVTPIINPKGGVGARLAFKF